MLLESRDFAVRHAASKDETRYNLNGVHIKDVGGNRAQLEATNGHFALRITQSEHAPLDGEFPTVPGMGAMGTVGEGFILPIGGVEQLRKAIPKGRQSMPILARAVYDQGFEDSENRNGSVRFWTTDLETATAITIRPIDGEFPDISAVIPDEGIDGSIQCTVDPRYLLQICQAAIEFAGPKAMISIQNCGQGDPLLFQVEAQAGGKLTGCLMPMRK